MATVRNDPLYGRWNMMKQRCQNPKNSKYKNYGAKGVRVCAEWQDFNNFKKWSLENGYKRELTIDRINTNGDYEPSNCRWVDQRVQQNNRSNNREIKCGDKKYTLAELSAEHRIDAETISKRLESGMSLEKSLSTPVNKHYLLGNKSLRKICHEKSMNYRTVHMRIKRGWDIEKALNTPVRQGNYK